MAGAWDARVTDEAGKPVPQYRPAWSRGWFTVRRGDDAGTVDLAARIPGYLEETTSHADQDAALAATTAAYGAYCADVAAAR